MTHRSSFRTGTPPPPRPVKQFYDKLFWFGFDPDVTRPTDRTMFGGTRGKFNAMDLLNDREARQNMIMKRRSLRGKRVRDPVVQDFGNVNDWNARKMGTSSLGGKDVGDDATIEEIEAVNDMRSMQSRPPLPAAGMRDVDMPPPMSREYDPMFEGESERRGRNRMLDYENDPRFYDGPYWDSDLPDGAGFYDDDMELEPDGMTSPRRTKPARRNSLSNRRRVGGRSDDRRGGGFSDFLSLPDSKRSQAEAYDRFIGLGPRPGEDYLDDDADIMERSSRRRKGYAYKYNADDDFNDDYIPYMSEYDQRLVNDVIDVRSESKYPTRSRKRSWEERALEMDRVPPRNAVAWGPNGRASGGGKDAQTKAALDALRDIERAKKILDKKEDMVVDAREEVASLKA